MYQKYIGHHVTVEGQLCGIAVFRISFPESGRDNPCVGRMGDAIPNDPAGKQVDDGAKIDSGMIDFEIGDIADPYLIGSLFSKMLPLHQISFFGVLQLHIELFRICADALQAKLLHDG